ERMLGELEAHARAQQPQLDLFAFAADAEQPDGARPRLEAAETGAAGIDARGNGTQAARAPRDGAGSSPADDTPHIDAPPIDGIEAEVLARLQALDPDALSAREALDLVYALHERLAARRQPACTGVAGGWPRLRDRRPCPPRSERSRRRYERPRCGRRPPCAGRCRSRPPCRRPRARNRFRLRANPSPSR